VEKERARRERKQKKQAQQSAPLTPAQEARQAKREAEEAAKTAEQARKDATEYREYRLHLYERQLVGLAESLSDVAWFNLLTDDQRQRYAALVPKLITLVEIVKKQMATLDVAEGVIS
jgi:uncharacterized membrane protein YcjF (UPF0283 family)